LKCKKFERFFGLKELEKEGEENEQEERMKRIDREVSKSERKKREGSD